MNTKSHGRFIVFEGIDGSGKSTQIRYLKNRIESQNKLCYETREPSDSPMGALVHQIMIGRIKTNNLSIAALFLADRLDHLLNPDNGLKDKIQSGVNVISDRYYFSSYAYHSVDVDMDWVIDANSVCADILKPDCTIFIDISPELAMQRIAAGRTTTELFETKERLTLVRENYLKAFDKFKGKENVIIIDGNQSPEKIADEIWEKVSYLF